MKPTSLNLVERAEHDVAKAKALLLRGQGLRSAPMITQLRRLAIDELRVAARSLDAAIAEADAELCRRAA